MKNGSWSRSSHQTSARMKAGVALMKGSWVISTYILANSRVALRKSQSGRTICASTNMVIGMCRANQTTASRSNLRWRS
eukprot:1073054-Pyramimonas_sp.AAC.1